MTVKRKSLASIEKKIIKLHKKAAKFAIFEDMGYDESMAIPEVSTYTSKGLRIMKRFDRIYHQYFFIGR